MRHNFYNPIYRMTTSEFFLNRRTIRRYSSQPVDDAILNEMLREASQAPTTGNMQLYSVIITRNDDEKARLAPAHFNQPSVTGCSAVLTFCADYNRFVKWCRASDAEPGYNNFQSFMTAVIDTVIMAQQFCTIAEMRGLGCCYLGTTTYNAPMIAEALGLPQMVVPVVTLTVGYPEGDSAVSDRLPESSFIHYGHYTDPGTSEVKEFYREKESREDSRRFVEENGKKTLAQVFTDVRYTRKASETFSKIYYDFIAGAGFPFPDSGEH